MEAYINIFKALSDETRLKILLLMSKKSICAKGIAKHLNISEAAVSQQIKILKKVNLIIGYKIGYHIIYDLNYDTLKKPTLFIENLINKDTYNYIFSDSQYNTECFKKCAHKKCFNENKFKEELSMKVCFPVKSNEGLQSVTYNHFGNAPHFIICDLESNEIKSVNNGDLNHEHGKCQPIKALSGEVVDAVIVGGIGAGAILKLNSMGIKVYKACQGTIEENIKLFKENKLPQFDANNSCTSHNCH